MNQSVMQPAGPAAEAIADIGWLLILGGTGIFIGVMLLLAVALRRGGRPVRPMLWILGGGVVFPTGVLAALFVYTLPFSPSWRPLPPPGSMFVSVTGHMWWWEVRYRSPDGSGEIVTANEIRVPVGRPVYFALASKDVIHTFWVPALAGKIDMVPGRLHHLQLTADRAGIYRGQCAEFCGEQHALMALHVVAQPPAEFDSWLRAQARPAAVPATEQQIRGQAVFLANRCDACHSVRGTGEPGKLGPDLTHVAGRLHLGAATLRNGPEALAQWVAHVQRVKPGARMPSYERLRPEELAALAHWLGSLQ
jgi:cytochrome c oxidase subunit II